MRKLLRIFLLALVFAGASGSWAHAQQRSCGFDAKMQEMQANDPDHALRMQAFEAKIRDWIARHPQERTATASYVIPVVVHVVQAGQTDLISDACIQSQIDALNADFQLLNADTTIIPPEFQSVVGNVDLEFCLATIDPNGNATDGILRIVDPGNANHSMANESQLKALSQWDPTKYLNMWVPATISGGILGYATFPTALAGNPAHDGVVINGEYFGTGACAGAPYDLGRTATHEVGHWLGLYHTFQGGCAGTSPADCATSGDNVCDTPPTSGSNFGCPGVQNTCTETPNDMNDQTMNFMDYTDDACMVMFSAGQVDRMHAVLATERNVIASQANNAATGCGCSPQAPCAPEAGFLANNVVLCPGQTIQFSDNSRGPADTWSWTFTGGNPSTSTSQNPVVTYANPGTYDVTLTITNALGTSTTTEVAYVSVIQPGPPPVVEGFEQALPLDWTVQNPDNAGTWTITNLTARSGLQCIYLDNWTYDAMGGSDAVDTRVVDLTNYATGDLTFDYAYQMAAFINDTMNVYVSTDCGETWNLEWSKGGGNLATAPGVGIAQAFQPLDSTQWSTESIDITNYLGQQGVKFRFECVGWGGQNLWLDNINLTAFVGVKEAMGPATWQASVHPNPFRDGLSLDLDVAEKANIRISISDLQGRQLIRTDERSFAPGLHTLRLDDPQLAELAGGIYLLNLDSDRGRKTIKLVKMD